MAINDGGPAYPRAGFWTADGPSEADAPPQTGMSLRDYYAASAMQALMTNEASRERTLQDARQSGRMLTEETAAFAFSMADAMLAERDKHRPSSALNGIDVPEVP